MQRVPASKTLPDVSPEERAWSETLKQIRKLRWIGMEREAQRLQAALKASRVESPSDLSTYIMMRRNLAPLLPLLMSNLG